MKYDEIRLAWNAQADDEKQWNSLTEAEKIEWAARLAAVKARGPVPIFSQDAQQTLQHLQRKGFNVVGYALEHCNSWTDNRSCTVDSKGLVRWMPSADQEVAVERAARKKAQAEVADLKERIARAGVASAMPATVPGRGAGYSMAGVIDWGGLRNSSMRGMNTTPTPHQHPFADVAARNRYVSAIDLGEIQASDPLYAPAGCFSVTLESLVLHPNGWVLSGRGDAQTFWLQVQQVGWMRFERVPRPDCSTDAISQATSWIATEMHPGPCPDPHQSVSWSGVLWTRRAALQAHQAICAYQQGLGQID